MVLAATSLLIAAVGRFAFLPPAPNAPGPRFAIWFLPVLVAMASEWKASRRVQWIYVLGLVIFFIRVFSVPVVTGTIAWRSFAHWVLGMAA